MHGRERGQILYKLADLMEVRCGFVSHRPPTEMFQCLKYA